MQFGGRDTIVSYPSPFHHYCPCCHHTYHPCHLHHCHHCVCEFCVCVWHFSVPHLPYIGSILKTLIKNHFFLYLHFFLPPFSTSPLTRLYSFHSLTTIK